MPLTRVAYPYPDTFRIPSLLAESSTVSNTATILGTLNSQYVQARNTIGSSIANGESQFRTISPDGNYDLRLWMRNDAGGFYYYNANGGSANVLRIAHSTTPRLVTQLIQDFTPQTSANFGGRVNIETLSTTEPGLVVRSLAGQSGAITRWQNSAGSSMASVDSSGNITTSGLVQGLASLHAGNIISGPRFSVDSNNANAVVAVIRGASGQVSNLQEWQNNLGNVVASISPAGNLTLNGDLTVNGTTSTINSVVLSVDDKNIEMGAVAAVTVSTTGTVGSITGTGPWTATITGMTDTADLIVGSAITATNGTGSLGAGGTYIVSSIVSSTSITYTATGGTTPVAGTVTNISTTGATDTTANGGGIILKGATDKSILWDSTNSNWTSTEHLNLASTKIFKINNSQVLSSTAVLGLTPTINATGYTLSGGTTAVAVTFAGGAAYTLSGTNGQTYTFPSTGGTLPLNNQQFFIGTQAIAINQGTGTITSLPGVTSVNGTTIPNAATLLTSTTGVTTFSGGTTGLTPASGTSGAITLAGTLAVANGGTGVTSSTGSTSVVLSSSPTITTPVIDTINASATTATTSLHPTVTTGSIAIGAGLTTGALNIATVGTGATPISIGHTNATIGITGNTSITGTLTSTSTIQGTTGTFTGSTLAINGASPTISSTNASAASIFTGTVTGVSIGSSTIKTTAYPADGTTSTAAAGEGYMGMPQVSTGVSRSFAATDAGKHVYVTATGTTQTIPANGTVAFPIGTTIVVVNGNSVSTSIAITTDTLRLANSTSTGTRTLASNGMCTLLKINTTEWIASGNGLT